MKHPDPLTYRFPRTMEEAFPNPVERGYAVFGYRQLGTVITRWAVRATCVLLTLLLLGHFAS